MRNAGEPEPLELRRGPFISGSTHAVLFLGQRPLSAQQLAAGTEDVGVRKKVTAQRPPRQSKPALAPAPRGRGRGTVTLQDLVEAGYLAPGKNRLSVTYKGTTYIAGLSRTGSILYEGQSYGSATAFSIYCKRQQTPNKHADDGWKSVMYAGRPLEHYRRLYWQGTDAAAGGASAAMRTSPALSEDEDEEEEDELDEFGVPIPSAAAAAAATEAAAAPAGEGAAAAVVGTDQWVQCDRCRTWRIVPDAAWPAVEADERDVWFCSDATWDLTAMEPFTPSCA